MRRSASRSISGPSAVLQWANQRLEGTGLSVANFTSDWADGLALCALVASLTPELALEGRSGASAADRRANFEEAFAVAERHGCPRLLDVDDMFPVPEKLSTTLYVSELRKRWDAMSASASSSASASAAASDTEGEPEEARAGDEAADVLAEAAARLEHEREVERKARRRLKELRRQEAEERAEKERQAKAAEEQAQAQQAKEQLEREKASAKERVRQQAEEALKAELASVATPKSAKSAVAAAKANEPGLTVFDLSGNTIFQMKHSEYAKELGSALATNTHIRELHLKQLDLDKHDAAALMEGLRVNRSVELVDLEKNKIDNEGAIAIADALRDNTHIRELNLLGQSRPFGDPCLQAFIDMFEYNVTLTKIIWRLDSRKSFAINKLLVRNNTIKKNLEEGRDVSSLLPEHCKFPDATAKAVEDSTALSVEESRTKDVAELPKEEEQEQPKRSKNAGKKARKRENERRRKAEEEAKREEEERIAREKKKEEEERLKEEKMAREKKEMEERIAREKKDKAEKAAREKQEKEENAAREKKEKEEKLAREKKEKDEKLAREKKEKEESSAREKKEKEVMLAREKREKEEKAAREKKKEAEEREKREREEKAAREKQAKEDKAAREKKDNEEKLARKNEEEAKEKREKEKAAAQRTQEKEEKAAHEKEEKAAEEKKDQHPESTSAAVELVAGSDAATSKPRPGPSSSSVQSRTAATLRSLEQSPVARIFLGATPARRMQDDFVKFLDEKHCGEMGRFLRDLAAFKHDPSLEEARRLVDIYVPKDDGESENVWDQDGSQEQLNLPANIIRETRGGLEFPARQITEDFFNDVEFDVLRLLRVNHYDSEFFEKLRNAGKGSLANLTENLVQFVLRLLPAADAARARRVSSFMRDMVDASWLARGQALGMKPQPAMSMSEFLALYGPLHAFPESGTTIRLDLEKTGGQRIVFELPRPILPSHLSPATFYFEVCARGECLQHLNGVIGFARRGEENIIGLPFQGKRFFAEDRPHPSDCSPLTDGAVHGLGIEWPTRQIFMTQDKRLLFFENADQVVELSKDMVLRVVFEASELTKGQVELTFNFGKNKELVYDVQQHLQDRRDEVEQSIRLKAKYALPTIKCSACGQQIPITDEGIVELHPCKEERPLKQDGGGCVVQ